MENEPVRPNAEWGERKPNIFMRIDGKVVLKVHFMYTTYSECVWVASALSCILSSLSRSFVRWVRIDGGTTMFAISWLISMTLAPTSISVVRRSCAHLETSLEFRWCHPTKKGRCKSHIIIIYRAVFVVSVHARVMTSAYHVVITSDINIMCTEVVGSSKTQHDNGIYFSVTRHMSHASDGEKRYCFRTSPIVRMQRESDSDANRMITITTIIICGTHISRSNLVNGSCCCRRRRLCCCFNRSDAHWTGVALSFKRSQTLFSQLPSLLSLTVPVFVVFSSFVLLTWRIRRALAKHKGLACLHARIPASDMWYAAIRLQARSLSGRASKRKHTKCIHKLTYRLQ